MDKKQGLRILLVIVLVAVIIAVLYFTKPQKTPTQISVAPVNVTVFQVRTADIQPTSQVTGRLQPAHKAKLRFEVSGRLATRDVEPGEQVAAGARLLTLAKGDFVDALAQARAQLAMEKAGIKRDKRLLEIARRDHALQLREVKRLEGLGSKSLVSASKLDQARQRLLQLESESARLAYQVETATARLEVSRTKVAQAERQLARTELTAPFSGTVNSVAVQAGDYVTPTQSVVELVDIGHIDFYAEVDGDTASALTRDTMVNVLVEGRAHSGKVLAFQSDPDPATFTHAVRIRLEGDSLLPGQLARAELPLHPQSQVLLVPLTAVLREEGRDYVFTLHNGVLQRLPVELGIRYQDSYVVQHGLQAGQQIVKQDVAALTNGQQAVVVEQ